MKKLIFILLAFIFILPLAACETQPGENGDNNTYVNAEPLEIPQPQPITAAAEIGVLPPASALPAPDPAAAPYVFGGGVKDDGIELDAAEGQSVFSVSYENIGTWDYFYIDIANYSPAYGFLMLSADGNTAVTSLTVAAAYSGMESLPLVPVLVDNMMKDSEKFFVDLSAMRTIDAAFELTSLELVQQSIERLYFFMDSNPAQRPQKAAGEFSMAVEFTKFHPQRPTYQGGTPEASSGYYTLGVEEPTGDKTVFRAGTSQVAGSYVDFPIESYYHEGSEFTDLNVSVDVRYTRSVSVGLVFEGGEESWLDYVILKTFSVTGNNNYLNGTYSETINAAQGQIRTAAGEPVANEFATAYKIVAVRLFIDSGAATYAEGTATGQADRLSSNSERLVTVRQINFTEAVQGVRIGKGWFLMDTNDYIDLQPGTVEMGGIGKVTVNGKGGWTWFAMPVTDFVQEAKLITIRVKAPTEYLHLGVELAFTSGAYKVVNGSAGVFNYEQTELGEYPFTRTISYNREQDFYTLTIDLTGSDLDNPRLVLSEIRFYLNDPAADTPNPGTFEVEFLGVTVTIPE